MLAAQLFNLVVRDSYFVSGAIHIDFLCKAPSDSLRDIRSRPFVLRCNKASDLKDIRQEIRETRTGIFKAYFTCNGDCAPESETYQIEAKVKGLAESVQAKNARHARNRKGKRSQCPVHILVPSA